MILITLLTFFFLYYSFRYPDGFRECRTDMYDSPRTSVVRYVLHSEILPKPETVIPIMEPVANRIISISVIFHCYSLCHFIFPDIRFALVAVQVYITLVVIRIQIVIIIIVVSSLLHFLPYVFIFLQDVFVLHMDMSKKTVKKSIFLINIFIFSTFSYINIIYASSLYKNLFLFVCTMNLHTASGLL